MMFQEAGGQNFLHGGTKVLLRSGSTLSIHKVVKYMTENFVNIHGLDVTIDD